MTALFPKWTNHLPALLAIGSGVGAAVVTGVVWFWFSPRNIEVGYQPLQPVLYSHQLHVGQKGMDCRYCHHTVDKASHASVPATETCMNCHSQIAQNSELLQPVRDSYASGNPVEWTKVHMLPDYAYFNHAAHVTAGVGCASCHGRIDTMEIVRQVEPLSMGWCLECHRNPAPHIRPLDEVTNMEYVVDPAEGQKLIDERRLNPPTHCSACHR